MKTLSIIACLFLSACASSQMVLPQNQMEPFAAALDRTSVRTPLSFSIASVQDQRTLGDHQLGWTNGSPDDRAPIVVERTVGETFADQLKKELNLRGFQSGVPGDVSLSLTIHKFDLVSVPNGAFQTPSCNAEMSIDLSRDKGKRKASATVKVNSSFTAPAPLFKKQLANSQTVASCLNLITERLVKNEEFQRLLTE